MTDEEEYDVFADLSKDLDKEYEEKKELQKIANISVTIPDQYYPDMEEDGDELDEELNFQVHGGKQLSPSELAEYRSKSSEDKAKELEKLIKEQTEMFAGTGSHPVKIDVERVFDNSLLINYGLVASRSEGKTQTPQVIYHDREATKEEKEAEEKGWQDWANQTELPKATYTLGDMRDWHELLNDGQPYYTILTFGHGKNRVTGEGWSGGEYVSGRAHAVERAFVKLLGRETYARYMDELLGRVQKVRASLPLTKKIIPTEKARLSVPLNKKTPLTDKEITAITEEPELKKKTKEEEEKERLRA